MTRPQPATLLRPCAEADLPTVAAIYAHHVRTGCASFEEEPPDLPEVARRREAVLARGLPWLVAERDGAVLGYSYAAPYRPRPAYRFTVEDSVYVAPAAARQGLGRQLLSALIAASEAAGARRMVAVIGDGDVNNLASVRLHAALGFEHAGTLPAVGFKHGRWVSTVLMQRPLGRGDGTPPASGA